MQTRHLTQAALDDAFKANVGKLFTQLYAALISASDNPEAVEKATGHFRKGLSVAELALAKAKEVAEG